MDLKKRVTTKNKSDSLGIDMIQTSKIGLEFYALLERFRVYNDENMKDESTQTVEPKKPESK